MWMLSPPYALWSIWKSLSTLQRSFILLLGVVGAYSLVSAATTLLRLHSIRQAKTNSDLAPVRASLLVLQRRFANMRQALRATFYLFGFILFFGLESIGYVLADTNRPLSYYVLGNFICNCAFAANVFLIFFTLQLVEWLVSRQLSSCLETLKFLS